ncbi:MAG: cupredoxin domain-containing protein [Bacillota bacterium]
MKRQSVMLMAVLALVAIGLALMLRSGETVGIQVTLSDYAIATSPYEVKRGDQVTMTIQNVGKVAHELEIEGYDLEVEDIQPGQTHKLTFKATRAGTFELVCHLDDHYQRGMYTTFQVHE